MSEIAKSSPRGNVGPSTSAATFFIFIGYVLGPLSCAAVVRLTASYPSAFVFLEIFPVTGAICICWLVRRSAKF